MNLHRWPARVRELKSSLMFIDGLVMAYSVQACLWKSGVISSSSPGIAQVGWVFAWLKRAIETQKYCEYMNIDNDKVKPNVALNHYK